MKVSRRDFLKALGFGVPALVVTTQLPQLLSPPLPKPKVMHPKMHKSKMDILPFDPPDFPAPPVQEIGLVDYMWPEYSSGSAWFSPRGTHKGIVSFQDKDETWHLIGEGTINFDDGVVRPPWEKQS